MLKRILYGSGAIGALTAAFLFGSVSLGGAFAQASPAPSSSAQSQTAPAATEQADTAEQGNASEQADSAALSSQARISVDQANAAALASVPGGTVKKTDLGNENGTLVYDVQLTDRAGKGQEVKVDATTGRVLSTQADLPETPGAAEQSDAGSDAD